MSKSGNQRISSQNHEFRKRNIADDIPSLRRDLQNAKLFLQQRSDGSGDSLFDHLSRVIAKVIDERPKNVIDHFELFSERVRIENFQLHENKLEDVYKQPERLKFARERLSVLIPQSQDTITSLSEKSDVSSLSSKSIANGEDKLESEEEDQNAFIYHEAEMKDLCELQFYWNLFGIGFPREEVFSLSSALKQLKRKNASVDSCRFWGKIFGLQNDYYVAECTFTTESLEKRIVSGIFQFCWMFDGNDLGQI